jgi:hypothetical protein
LGNFEEAAGRVRVEVANMGPSSLIEIWWWYMRTWLSVAIITFIDIGIVLIVQIS